jgi:glycosyltransferase involved in cell wall biosynthesis
MRLAWFTPWRPQPSGIAGRSVELVAALAVRGHGIDVFVDEQDSRLAQVVTRVSARGPEPGEIRLQGAHDFVWRAARGQYALVVYQIGNSRLHEFIWPYLFQWPGLVILHDARLHHARGRSLLRRDRFEDYRSEFAWNHPQVSRDLAELAVHGFDGSYYYEWPMTRALVESARLVACHSRGAVEELRQIFPGRPIEYVALGEGPHEYNGAGACERFRAAHGIEKAAVVFGVHGALTPEKRVPEILRAFAATRRWLGHAHLLLAGRADPALGIPDQIAELGLGDTVTLSESLSDEAFDEAIAASDVSLNLRWPTALETSGPWVRSLALSKASIIVDLAHQGHVPALDPRTWHRHAPCEDPSAEADSLAVAVAVDILDEGHSLRLALRRLGQDEELRTRLGREARRHWEREHTVDRMVDDVERTIARAVEQPVPAASLPDHLRPDPAASARSLTASFDVDLDGALR